jgi:hypothetical protein
VSLLPFLFVALSLVVGGGGATSASPPTTTNPDGSAQTSIIPHMSAKNCYSAWIWFVAPSRHFGVFNRADHTKRPALHHLHQCEANDRGTYVMWATRVSFRSCTHPRVPTWRDMAADSTTPEGTRRGAFDWGRRNSYGPGSLSVPPFFPLARFHHVLLSCGSEHSRTQCL